MHIGDRLLNGLTSTNSTNLLGILELCCSYIDNRNDIVTIKKILGACINPPLLNRPKGCVMIIYNDTEYWRDAWNVLYTKTTVKRVGKYYPASNWASIGYE